MSVPIAHRLIAHYLPFLSLSEYFAINKKYYRLRDDSYLWCDKYKCNYPDNTIAFISSAHIDYHTLYHFRYTIDRPLREGRDLFLHLKQTVTELLSFDYAQYQQQNNLISHCDGATEIVVVFIDSHPPFLVDFESEKDEVGIKIYLAYYQLWDKYLFYDISVSGKAERYLLPSDYVDDGEIPLLSQMKTETHFSLPEPLGPITLADLAYYLELIEKHHLLPLMRSFNSYLNYSQIRRHRTYFCTDRDVFGEQQKHIRLRKNFYELLASAPKRHALVRK